MKRHCTCEQCGEDFEDDDYSELGVDDYDDRDCGLCWECSEKADLAKMTPAERREYDRNRAEELEAEREALEAEHAEREAFLAKERKDFGKKCKTVMHLLNAHRCAASWEDAKEWMKEHNEDIDMIAKWLDAGWTDPVQAHYAELEAGDPDTALALLFELGLTVEQVCVETWWEENSLLEMLASVKQSRNELK